MRATIRTMGILLGTVCCVSLADCSPGGGDIDAGEPDAGTVDAGHPDAGLVDAGPPVLPCAPTNVVATAGLDNAYLTWTAPACGTSIISSTITVTPSGATAVVRGAITHGYAAGLTAGTSYTFTVLASNLVGNGPPSSPSNAVTPFDCSAAGPEFSSDCANGQICTLTQLCVTPSYSTTANTVTDQVTGLIWQRSAPTAASADAGTDLYTFDSTGQSTSSAQAYCAQLNLDGYSSGWRLPTLSELFSIVELMQDGTGNVKVPTIDQTEFPGTQPGDYWTSTPESSTQYIWAVYFGPSGEYIMAGSEDPIPNGGSQFVRCVHQ